MKKLSRRNAVIGSLLCLTSILGYAAYPDKPIKIIVPWATGGATDQVGRLIAQPLSQALGVPVIVDNKAGAGGNIGTEFIAKATPDGYTIGMGNFAPLAVNKTLFGNLRYDPEKDLLPIVLIEKGPLMLVTNPSSPYKTVKDVIAAAKANPGKLTFSSGGIGGSHHLSAELFKQSAGIDMIHVPYKSGSAGLTDLMSGAVDLMFDQMYSAMPSVKANKLKAIAITSKTRSPLFPDVPTFVEAGLPKVVVLNWQGLVAPKGTPKAIIDKLNAAANEALKDPQLRSLMLAQGNEIGGGTPAEFAELIKAESIKWSAVVKAAHIKPE